MYEYQYFTSLFFDWTIKVNVLSYTEYTWFVCGPWKVYVAFTSM